MVLPGNPRPPLPNPSTAAGADALAKLADGWGSKPGFFAFLAGILFPLAALIAELGFRMCGPVFFDPIPSPLHLLLVALVPAANLAAFIALRSHRAFLEHRAAPLLFLNGASVGITAFYALLFLPLLPIGVAAIFLFGLGLLLLAPAFSFWGSVALRRHLSNNLVRKPRGFAYGLLASFAILAGSELRATLTKVGVDQASSADADTRRRGVRLLRAVGNEDLLLRYCYGLPGRATDMTGLFLTFGRGTSLDEARAAYWRAFGQPFNAIPAPAWQTADRGLFADWGFARDWNQGGEAVGGILPGLSLAASNIAATLDAGAALSYQEWTLEFRNTADEAAEARAQIRLPPEGVVSRLTLWVDGEEREAAFAGRGRVREAYERVVKVERRDPVLVTTQGKDRILLQCFPVPVGGRMKVRIGITAPLAFTSAGEAHFHLPAISERNFAVTSSRDAHSLRLESDEPFVSPGPDWTAGTREEGLRHVLEGTRGEAWLSAGRSLPVGEARGGRMAWSGDPRLGGDIAQQWTEFAAPEALGELTVVVDGSRGMAPFAEEVAAALRKADRPVQVFLAAAEEVREYQGTAQRAGDWLERQPFAGGQDNVPALLRAWEHAPDAKGAVVLWVHAGQPLILESPETLRNGLERQANGPRLLSLQLDNGPDRILEDFAALPMVENLRLSGGLREELAARVSPVPPPRLVLKRKRVPAAEGPGKGVKTSDHLARLLVHGEILRKLDGGSPLAWDQAATAAGLFQLVTPASGAVVLENASQYAQAGLTPSDPATVPGVPEPELAALAAAVVLLFAISALRSRRRRKHV